MLMLEERVDRLEEMFARFLEESSLLMAGIHEDVAGIHASNARTDHQLLLMQQQAEKDRQQAEKDRQQAEKDRQEADRKWSEMQQQAEKNRQEADRKWSEMQQQAERDRQQAEKDRQKTEKNRQQDREEAERHRQEADRKWSEMQQQAEKDRQQADRKWSEMQQQAEKDRQKAEKDRQKDREKAEKERKDFNRRLAQSTDAQGLLIENMVWPNLNRIAGEVFADDVVVTQAIRIKRLHPEDRGRMKEIDLLAVSPHAVLVCEAKSKPTSEKVREFLTSLQSFKEFFPEYQQMRVVPMMASISFDTSLVGFMSNQGVLALGFGDETMELLNPEAAKQASPPEAKNR